MAMSVFSSIPLPQSSGKTAPWISSSGPHPSLNNEIHCYSLPYGALGCASHTLTYYTILCLSQTPLSILPHPFFTADLVSIVTILRCRNTWQLLLVAVWKLDVSLLNGVTAVHVAILMRRLEWGGCWECGGGGSMSFFDRKDEKETVVGVTPFRIYLSGEQPRTHSRTPLQIRFIVDRPLFDPFPFLLLYFLTTHPINPTDIPGMLPGIITSHVPNPQVRSWAPGHTQNSRRFLCYRRRLYNHLTT